jgi:hypothetical protein
MRVDVDAVPEEPVAVGALDGMVLVHREAGEVTEPPDRLVGEVDRPDAGGLAHLDPHAGLVDGRLDARRQAPTEAGEVVADVALENDPRALERCRDIERVAGERAREEHVPLGAEPVHDLAPAAEG